MSYHSLAPGDRVKTKLGRRLIVTKAPPGHYVYCDDAGGGSAGRFEKSKLLLDDDDDKPIARPAVHRRGRGASRKTGGKIPLPVLEGRLKRLSQVVRARGGKVDCDAIPSSPTYTIHQARYAKGQMLVRCPSDTGFKTRAARLVEALRGRYTGRENGYVLSPSKAKKFEQLFADGWDGSVFTNKLRPPGED